MLKNYAKENGLTLVAGIDEVGRGSLAGPVVTAAVILPPEFKSKFIIDSKLICRSKKRIKKAYDIIMDNALYVHCDAKSAKIINKVGIEDATWESIHACIDDLGVTPEHILIDGDKYVDGHGIPYTTVVKGDNKYLSVAAASIVAKYRRDEYMGRVHEVYPHYGFDGNKGYFSSKHKDGLLEHGRCSYHRDKYVDTWEKNQAKL